MSESQILRADQLQPGQTITFFRTEPTTSFPSTETTPSRLVVMVLDVFHLPGFPKETGLATTHGNFWFNNGHTIVVTGKVTDDELEALNLADYERLMND